MPCPEYEKSLSYGPVSARKGCFLIGMLSSSATAHRRSIPLGPEPANPVYYTNSPKRLQNGQVMCIIRNNGKCGTLHFSGTRHSNGMLLLCAAAEAEQQQSQKTAFFCGNQPTRKAVFVFRAWQTHCGPVEYAIVTCSSCEQERIQLTAMLLAAEPGIDAGCVDIAVPKKREDINRAA